MAKWGFVDKKYEKEAWLDTRRFVFDLGKIKRHEVDRTVFIMAIPETIPLEIQMKMLSEMQDFISERISISDCEMEREEMDEKDCGAFQ